MAPTTSPMTPSPTPTWLTAAPAVGKEVVETAETDEVEVRVTTGPGPEVLGWEAVLPAGVVEPLLPIPLEDADAGAGAGGGMMVVAEAADGGDPVTLAAPVEALTVLPSPSVHTLVVAVAVIGSESDEAEKEGVEAVTLCVNVVAVAAAVDGEVAV
jgi:hypothetical protein